MLEAGEATCEEALRRADVAMYMAKSRGKGMLGLFEPSFNVALPQRSAELAVQRLTRLVVETSVTPTAS